MIRSSKPLTRRLPAADVYLISYGMNPVRDITLESFELLRRSPRVYTIVTSPILLAFLRQHGITFEDLTYLYVEGQLRGTIYRNIAAFVLGQAVAKPGICYLTYGHPMCLDKPVSLILDGARISIGELIRTRFGSEPTAEERELAQLAALLQSETAAAHATLTSAIAEAQETLGALRAAREQREREVA